MTARRWLVTGAGGFVGSRLVEILRARGVACLAWTRGHGNLVDRKLVFEGFRAFAPDVVCHLAAPKARIEDGDWRLPATESDILNGIAQAVSPSARILYAGSVSEYGYSGTFAEAAPRYPKSLYGFTKMVGSDLAASLTAQGIADIRVARLFGIFGPGEANSRLIPHLVAHLASGRPAPLGSPDHIRDFSYVDDVCESLIALAELDASPPVLNIGTGVGVSVREVSEQVAEILGADPALLCFGSLPTRAIDEDVLISDPKRARDLVPTPRTHWKAPSEAVQAYVRNLLDRVPA